jgi:glutathionylspermidine synthase
MLRVRLPQQPFLSPALMLSPDQKSQNGYWIEGQAYAITPDEAQQLRDAATEISRLYIAAMDRVTADETLLSKFSITGAFS